MAPQREAQSWAHVRADGRVSVCHQHGAVKVVLAWFLWHLATFIVSWCSQWGEWIVYCFLMLCLWFTFHCLCFVMCLSSVIYVLYYLFFIYSFTLVFSVLSSDSAWNKPSVQRTTWLIFQPVKAVKVKLSASTQSTSSIHHSQAQPSRRSSKRQPPPWSGSGSLAGALLPTAECQGGERDGRTPFATLTTELHSGRSCSLCPKTTVEHATLLVS